MSEHWRAFGSLFFLAHQNRLLWLINTPVIGWLFRRILRINGKSSSVGRRRITRILPHAIFWWEGDNQVAEFRTHAKFAKRLYYSLEPIWWTMHFWDWLVADRWIPRLSFGFDTLTKYPDADPESTTVDGYTASAYTLGNGVFWSTLRSDAGSEASGTASITVWIRSDNLSNMWRIIERSVTLFDTSSLGSNAIISAAVYSLYGQDKSDSLSVTPNIDVYICAPASNTALVAGDYATFGSTSQTGSPITYGSFSTTGYNDFSLDATGIVNINKTGISKYGVRNQNYDVIGTPPAWSSNVASYLRSYSADQAGTANDPKLVVTYTVGRISNARIILEARSDGTVTG